MQQEEKDQLLNEVAQEIALNPPQTESGEQIIDGLAQSELAGRIQLSAETYNLAQDMDDALRADIAREIWNGFEDDDKSRTEWLEKHAFWLSLYMQTDYEQNSDPERSWGATESIPILMEAADQFQARTYKVFFPNDTFVSAIPMRRTKRNRKQLEERAKRIGDHMSYQLGYQDRTYRMDKDALFLGVAVHGSFFTKTYFSEAKKRFQVDNVRPTDLVVNYTVGPTRMEDLRRKTHVIYTTVGATEEMVQKGFFVQAAAPADCKINDTYNLVVDEVMGLDDPQTQIKRDRQAVLLEQHVYLDLDDAGLYRPYIATICAASRKLMRLTIGYEADPTGIPLKDYEQTQYFTHYKYKENPDGFYGLGLGHSIGDLNSAANIMLRQSMDAATLANDGNMSGFVSENLGLEGDELRMVLGRLRKIPSSVADFQNSIMLMKFPGPNEAQMKLMEQIDLRAQRLGAVTEATTGTIDKVVQPTTLITQIEQAMEQFSAVQLRLANSLSEEFQKIYRINQKYLPLVDYFVVNDEPEAITRNDYADDMLIQPVFDPKYATQAQKVARAQAELEATLQNPINQGRPQVIDEAFRRYFEALDVEDVDALIPPQPQIENIDDQRVENMFFIMPPEARPMFDVFPTQDHVQHLALMDQLAPYEGLLQPEQKEAILKHRLKHEAYLYGQQQGVVPPPPPEGLPTPPLAGRPGLQASDGGIAPDISGSAPVGAPEVTGTGVAGGGPTAGF